ncbi:MULTISPECIES: GNAT family N-acetyltransferase [Shewanella]|uniref:GNAT family N-acetyltransferase n=1 Tax=Shewanella TaxID=22 RepID=UPI00048F13B7|nr:MULTISPECIES: GNAT family N-acetyltransferase [Shewanella]QLE84199.1 GNAT family N-acetyltransferase [Shewanella sp. Scap07]
MSSNSATLNTINQQDDAVFEQLVAGVRQFNVEHMGDEKSQPLMVVARDEHGVLIGGVAGCTIYRNYLIEVVWVAENQRGSGLGKRLMMQAEAEAKSRGCVVAQLDTLGFQAQPFYQKLGFEVVGEVPELVASPARYFMLKHY